jgi:hypothetical protein
MVRRSYKRWVGLTLTFRQRFWSQEAISVQDNPIGSVAQSIQGGYPQEAVREDFSPLGEVQVTGDDRGPALITFSPSSAV